MNEVPIKTACPACAGRGFAPTGEIFKLCGRVHQRVGPCQACEGKGTQLTWLDLHEFVRLLYDTADKLEQV